MVEEIVEVVIKAAKAAHATTRRELNSTYLSAGLISFLSQGAGVQLFVILLFHAFRS